MPLIHDAEPGDTIRIGNITVVKVERKNGQRTRLRIETDYPIRVERADRNNRDPAAGIVQRPVVKR